MSDRLTISAAMSVLMMAIYVLFGSETVRVPVGSESFDSPVSIGAPDLQIDTPGLFRVGR